MRRSKRRAWLLSVTPLRELAAFVEAEVAAVVADDQVIEQRHLLVVFGTFVRAQLGRL